MDSSVKKLELIGVNKYYPKPNVKGAVHALKDFSYIFTPGIYGLLGKNGSGKSTLMNVLTGYLKYDSGQILVNDKPVDTHKTYYKELLGYMPQQQVLYDNMTIEQFLNYFARLKGVDKKAGEKIINDLIEGINLSEKRRKCLNELSGGMKQRVLFAQALLGNPSIILLDEPTAGVDPEERANLQRLIGEYCKGKIVIMSTHILSDIENLAKENVALSEGKIVEC